MQLNDRLIKERKRLGLTQDEMAAKCGTPKRTYCDYESGKSEPRGSFFETLGDAGADVLYILTGQRASDTLTPDEAALLDNFRAIPAERKFSLIDVASALASAHGDKKATG